MSLASAIVFGLSFATVLTLIVTPAMLALPQRLRDLIKRQPTASSRRAHSSLPEHHRSVDLKNLRAATPGSARMAFMPESLKLSPENRPMGLLVGFFFASILFLSFALF